MTFKFVALASASSIQIVADDFPPYNYVENGKITGVSTEIVQAVLEELGLDVEIKIYPWVRAYDLALKKENVLIFTIARSPKREHLFKWIGPVGEYNAGLFVLESRADVQLDSLDDARKYNIGATAEDVRTQYLLEKDFVRVQQVPKNELNIGKLVKGRIDLWLENELTAYHLLKKNGYDKSLVRKVFEFEVGTGGYMAFSNETSDLMVNDFKQALKRIHKKGVYEAILQGYR
ncbi:substrate-binding periplasmic protein [Kiloniella sp.]|uniref:substrate-binding periplasmic protein n=1 Tax=Kiloniella sp. TaxID=1938587 RepID=UPI003B01A678